MSTMPTPNPAPSAQHTAALDEIIERVRSQKWTTCHRQGVAEVAALIDDNKRLRAALANIIQQPGPARIYSHLAEQETCDDEDARFCQAWEQAKSALSSTTPPAESAETVNAELLKHCELVRDYFIARKMGSAAREPLSDLIDVIARAKQSRPAGGAQS